MSPMYQTRAFFRDDGGFRRSGLEGVEVRAREGSSVQQRRSHSRTSEVDRGSPMKRRCAGAQPCARVVRNNRALRVLGGLPGFGGLLRGRMRVRVGAPG